MSKAETNSEKIEEAARLATESLERFRSAARKERESRGDGRDDRARIVGESIAEQGRALEQFYEAVELLRQTFQEQERAFGAGRPPKAKPEQNGKKRGWEEVNNKSVEERLLDASKSLDGGGQKLLEDIVVRYRLNRAVDVNNLSPSQRELHERNLMEEHRELQKLVRQFEARLN